MNATSNNQPIVVYEFEKNALEKVRICLDHYKGSRVIDLRVFSQNGEDYIRTKKGITLHIDHLSHLKNAIYALEERIKELSK